jgi:hypothetical protein
MWDGPIQPHVVCYSGKIGFHTRGEAQWHGERGQERLRPYLCWHCHQFHLHNPGNTPRRVAYHDLVKRQPMQQEQEQ